MVQKQIPLWWSFSHIDRYEMNRPVLDAYKHIRITSTVLPRHEDRLLPRLDAGSEVACEPNDDLLLEAIEFISGFRLIRLVRVLLARLEV